VLRAGKRKRSFFHPKSCHILSRSLVFLYRGFFISLTGFLICVFSARGLARQAVPSGLAREEVPGKPHSLLVWRVKKSRGRLNGEEQRPMTGFIHRYYCGISIQRRREYGNGKH
jgi:hypothetical protein